MYKVPSFDKIESTEEVEEIANELFNSGKLRIEDDFQKCNFAKYYDKKTGLFLTFSYQELYIQKLLDQTYQKLLAIFSKYLHGKELDTYVRNIISTMQKDVKNTHPVSDRELLGTARLLAECNHPIVFKWLIYEEVEIFVSYSYSVGEMMDYKSWKEVGKNSGLQRTDGLTATIFVSSGGNPFNDQKEGEENPMYGDGWPATARLMIIAAQEIGHYADIERNIYGEQISRHSANFSGTYAKKEAKYGRLKDMENTNKFWSTCIKCGILNLIKYEYMLKFFEKHKIITSRKIWNNLGRIIWKIIFNFRMRSYKEFSFIYNFKHEYYYGLLLKSMTDDMLFNLAPKADVYKNPNKDIEEAIACIEALARVPQQAVKWGHDATKYFMNNLYKLYYDQVIPHLITVYESVTKKKFVRKENKTKYSIWEWIKYKYQKFKDKKQKYKWYIDFKY
jgi:hypothetical protein